LAKFRGQPIRLIDGIKDSGLRQSLKKLDFTNSPEIREIKKYLRDQRMDHIHVTQLAYVENEDGTRHYLAEEN
jgi:hypothetical protein